MAVDFGEYLKACSEYRASVYTVLPVGCFPPSKICHIHQHILRGASDREVAFYLILMRSDDFDVFASECDVGVSLGIQEIPTLEMCIAIRFTSPQLPGINSGADCGISRRKGIEPKGASRIFEMASHPRDHHVATAKLCCGMTRFKFPLHRVRSFQEDTIAK